MTDLATFDPPAAWDLGPDVDPFDPTAAPTDRILRPVDEADLPEHLLNPGTGSLTAESGPVDGPTPTRHPADLGSPARGDGSYPLEVVGPDEARAPIRAWFDDAGQLVRFVISNRWRERLLGRDLGEAITEVLRQPRITAAAVTAPYEPIALPTQLTQEWLDQMYEETTRDWEAASASFETPQQTVTGRSRSRLVGIQMGPNHSVQSVHIDPVWLSRCRVSDLCEAVIEAFGSAASALAQLPPDPIESLSHSMSARSDALFAVLTGRTAA